MALLCRLFDIIEYKGKYIYLVLLEKLRHFCFWTCYNATEWSTYLVSQWVG